MRTNYLSALLAWSWLSATALATGHVVHDSSFAPDHILRVGVSDIQDACETRRSVVVNGTSPGPTLHILPGGVTWIRVYNDMDNQNLTMVSCSGVVALHREHLKLTICESIGMVCRSAWPLSQTELRWLRNGLSRLDTFLTMNSSLAQRTQAHTTITLTSACRP